MKKCVHVSIDEQGLCDCEGVMCGAIINGVHIKPGDYQIGTFITKLEQKGEKEYCVKLPGSDTVKMSVQEIDFLLRRMEEIAESKTSLTSWESLII